MVYEGLDKQETVRCPKDRTVLITDEPPSIKKYDQDFLNQFHTIVTCQRDVKHPNVIHTQKAHPWMIGCTYKLGLKPSLAGVGECTKDYDELKSMRLPLPKNKLMSIVSSGKRSTPGHIKRLLFATELKKYFKDKLDVYGRGINNFEDKWEVVEPYKYHITIENSSYPDYYTEKLIDAFLGGAYPLYYGCPNVDEYFPLGALQKIDINDIKGSIQVIEKCLAENTYEKNLDLIAKSRDLLLEKYNIFPFLCNELFKSLKPSYLDKKSITIAPEVTKKPGFVKRVVEGMLSKAKRF